MTRSIIRAARHAGDLLDELLFNLKVQRVELRVQCNLSLKPTLLISSSVAWQLHSMDRGPSFERIPLPEGHKVLAATCQQAAWMHVRLPLTKGHLSMKDIGLAKKE